MRGSCYNGGNPRDAMSPQRAALLSRREAGRSPAKKIYARGLLIIPHLPVTERSRTPLGKQASKSVSDKRSRSASSLSLSSPICSHEK